MVEPFEARAEVRGPPAIFNFKGTLPSVPESTLDCSLAPTFKIAELLYICRLYCYYFACLYNSAGLIFALSMMCDMFIYWIYAGVLYWS